MVQFIIIENVKVAGKSKADSFNHELTEGHNFISGRYLE